MKYLYRFYRLYFRQAANLTAKQNEAYDFALRHNSSLIFGYIGSGKFKSGENSFKKAVMMEFNAINFTQTI